MDKIIIEDRDYCKNCKLVNRYNELIDINNEHQKINGELREENKQLKEKINKAIEYIKHNKLYFYEYDGEELFEVVRSNKQDLLEILKGDSNE